MIVLRETKCHNSRTSCHASYSPTRLAGIVVPTVIAHTNELLKMLMCTAQNTHVVYVNPKL